MIELAIKGALERITGMNAYPLLLPDKVQEGVTYLRISDAQVGAGRARPCAKNQQHRCDAGRRLRNVCSGSVWYRQR